MALQNDRALNSNLTLAGRPVFMDTPERIELLREKLNHPNSISKLLGKMGIDTEDWIVKMAENQKELAKFVSLFGDYIKSKSLSFPRPRL